VQLGPAAPAYQRVLVILLKLLALVLLIQFFAQACSASSGGGRQMIIGLMIFVLGPMAIASMVFGRIGLGGVVQSMYSWLFRMPGRMSQQMRANRQSRPVGRGAFASTVSVQGHDGRNHLVEYTAMPGTVRIGDELTLYGRRRGGGSFRCYRLVNHSLGLDLYT
jgi:uncharacterized membrane protein